MHRRTALAAGLAALLARPALARPDKLAPPVADGPWLRPAADGPAEPVWGHADGLSVGLWPIPAPRGLIRVYAPFLGHRRPRVINFVSVEPVANGRRGQSELEVSQRSNRGGVDMWSADTVAAAPEPADPTRPARGQVEGDTLSVVIATEPFRNGAHPLIEVRFRADRPREVGFRLFAAPGSTAMRSCVLSATMGNYARLRRLWLNGQVADARKVWPTFQPDKLGFAPWRAWDRDKLFQKDGSVVVAATSDEADPAKAEYAPEVHRGWRYEGPPTTQYWRAKAVPGLVARVNGRSTYWASTAPIPGGVSFENVELEAPFAAGQEFWFGVTTDRPEALGFDPAWGREPTAG